MQLEVYQTDAEAYEAAAEIAAGYLVAAAGTGMATLALGGGRGARALQVALAARGEIAWARVTCVFTDERCAAGDVHGNLKVARDSLLAPRGVAADRIAAVPIELGDAPAIAAAYASTLERVAGTPPALDVVLLDLADDGSIAALVPGDAALAATTTVAAAPAAAGTSVPRVTITPVVLRAARHVVVTATGDDRAAAVAAALRDPVDVARRPAQLVLPSPTVTWVVDRAAAAALLRDARPAQ